jgi:nicotinamide-nucleotide amidase
MAAEIISVGTEITSGAKLDTNSQWLSLQLAEIGIATHYHTTVADSLADNVAVFKTALSRADVVLVTGGLGPTLDDLTREALAAALGVKLELHAPSLDVITAFFRSRGREMPARNQMQALFPQGCEPLPNPIGTAPGIWWQQQRPQAGLCCLAAMPGVPSEMKKMYVEQVLPRLQGTGRLIRRARINCYGVGESQAEEMLGDLTARGRDPEVGITAHQATITLRIVAVGDDEAECQAKIDQTATQIRQRLGDFVYGVEDEELEDVVIRQLRQRHETVATIECATNGMIAQRLARISHAAQAYRGGVVLPLLDPDFDAIVMRVQMESQADHIIAVGPEEAADSSLGAAVSLIPIALFTHGQPPVRIALNWSGNPELTQIRACKSGLDLLRRRLLNLNLP